MTVEEQKILFADLYRMIGAAKDELKTAAKETDKLLEGHNWENLTMLVNGIIGEAAILKKIGEMIITAADCFLKNGPYEGQSAEYLPLERMAR